MSSRSPGWRRIWRPHHPLFWLVAAFQLLTAVLVLFLQISDPASALRWLLAAVALLNSVVGWWLLARLWRAPPLPQEQPSDVQRSADHQA
ncbi:MAG: hypothetical protein KF871_11155 [Hydrogenophaga sp.]|uniref:hypothetical protein n=1 Tax=Hydrogenophaga sp. TaxID=1904254 RepID=UPI001D3308AF|nr:hypothetical protein [Hydrogenophaga sp.]MBX3610441.1 hypothetical protein [Hydrogenophaga sp.]